MRSLGIAGLIVSSLLLTLGCSGATALNPTGPSPAPADMRPAAAGPPAAPAPGVPTTPPNSQTVTGVVGGPVSSPQSCYFGRPCELYPFTLTEDGGVEVTLTWEGHERALMIQLYRAPNFLVHEDLAPRGSAPRITFRRTDLQAMDYELRVVNIDNAGAAVPFTLTFTKVGPAAVSAGL